MKLMSRFNSAKNQFKDSRRINAVRNSMWFGNINLFMKKFSHSGQDK